MMFTGRIWKDMNLPALIKLSQLAYLRKRNRYRLVWLFGWILPIGHHNQYLDWRGEELARVEVVLTLQTQLWFQKYNRKHKNNMQLRILKFIQLEFRNTLKLRNLIRFLPIASDGKSVRQINYIDTITVLLYAEEELTISPPEVSK